MAAASHNPAFAKKVGIPTKVAKEFNQADKGKKFVGGGMAKEDMKMDMAQDKKMVKKAVGMHDKQLHGGKKTDLASLKSGGCTKMAKGGVAKTVTKEMEYDYKTGKKSFAGSTAKKDAHAEKEGKRVAKDLAYDKSKRFASGGYVRAADGCATKGKTKGKII